MPTTRKTDDGKAAQAGELMPDAMRMPRTGRRSRLLVRDPLEGVEVRLTYRKMRVLLAIAAHPGSTNREVAEWSQTKDEGQISRMLARLEEQVLVENNGDGSTHGGSNAWSLTDRGEAVRRVIDHFQADGFA